MLKNTKLVFLRITEQETDHIPCKSLENTDIINSNMTAGGLKQTHMNVVSSYLMPQHLVKCEVVEERIDTELLQKGCKTLELCIVKAVSAFFQAESYEELQI